MKICISNSFINNTIKVWNNSEYGEIINEQEILKKVYLTLKNDNVLNCQFNDIKWEKIFNQFQGIYIPIKNEVVYFCQKQTPNHKAKSRNTYISQNYNPASKFAKSRFASLSLSINPLDLGYPTPEADTIQKDLKTLITFGVKINNSITNPPRSGFNTLEEYLSLRSKLKNKNTGNNSTFISLDNDSIIVYGRLEGASGIDTINCCKIINLLEKNKKFKIFNISEKPFPSSTIKEIEDLGFELQDPKEIQKETEIQLSTSALNEELYEEILKRNQSAFIANILKKYSKYKEFDVHKCFCCEYNVEQNLIGSHIYRYADIKRDFFEGKLSCQEAAHLIVSGENGFLLCGTQDREFEKGQIYFDLEQKSFVANKEKLTDEQFNLVKEKIKPNDFSKIAFSSEFIKNIKEHHKRIGVITS